MKISNTARLATLDDIPEIIPLLREFFDVSPYTDFSFNEAKVRRLLEAAIITPSQAVVILSTDKKDNVEQIVGLIAGRLDEAPFSDDKSAIEMAWYVRPEFRKGKRAFELLDAFEAWAIAAGASFTYYGLLREQDYQPQTTVEKIYKHRGCSPAEAGYVKNLRKRK